MKTGVTPISTRYMFPNRPAISGAVPSGKRDVTPVPKDLLGLVSEPKGTTVEVKSNGTDPELDTVPLMKKKIRNKAWQVERLAKKLKGYSVYETVRNDWNFIFDHIQYIEDPKTVEAVRDPARTIYDGKGDCDCFTVLLGALLTGQKIPFKIRVAAYENPGEWNHVYIVVPDGDRLIIADPVMHQFDAETPFVDHKDFAMKLVSLEGTPGLANCEPTDKEINQSKYLKRYIDAQEVVMWGFIPTQEFLEENKIPYVQDVKENETEFLVTPPDGKEHRVPSILNHEQAMQLKALFAAIPATAAKNFKWWWLLAAAAGLFLVFGGDGKSENKDKRVDGLAGTPTPAKPAKKTSRKRKLKVVNV